MTQSTIINDNYPKSGPISDEQLKQMALNNYLQEQSKTYNFPTEIVPLPSKGLVYPETSPLRSGTVEMKYMTAREEDILTSANLIKQGVVLDKLMQSISKKVPGMEQMMGGMMGDMMGGMMGGKKDTKPKEKVVIDENFSTANVELFKKGKFTAPVNLSFGNDNRTCAIRVPAARKMVSVAMACVASCKLNCKAQINRAPIRTITIMIGKSQSFLLAFKNANSSFIKDISIPRIDY